jgi:hypothetical protein
MNVEIGTEATQFPEKEYINVIFVAVYLWLLKVGGQGHFSSQMVKGDMASGHCISTHRVRYIQARRNGQQTPNQIYIVFKEIH